MFAKPFRVKFHSHLNCSERKKFRASLVNKLPLTEESVLELVPNKEALTVSKLVTHAGDVVLVYSVCRLPIVFQRDDDVYPTVYALWKMPHLLYYYTTWPQVLPRITGGAHLMLPGVVVPGGPSLAAYGSLDKGHPVAVNLSSNRAAVAVGRTARSSVDMYMAANRGCCVHVLHHMRDELCSYGAKMAMPDLGPPDWMRVGAPETDADADAGRGGEDEAEPCGADADDEAERGVEEGDEPSGADAEDEAAEAPVVGSDVMDDLVRYCFLKAVTTTARKEEYPMLASKFYKLHMLPACPDGKALNFKQSSYKKLGKFLARMSELQVIATKETAKGVQSIMSVDAGHPMVRDFHDAQPPSAGEAARDDGEPVVRNHYAVTNAVLPLLHPHGLRKGHKVTASAVREILTEYIRTHGLEFDQDQRRVRLDAFLQELLRGKVKGDSLSVEGLLAKTLSCMTQMKSIEVAPQHMVCIRADQKPVNMRVETRTHNKKVTVVENLELYGIDLAEFVRDCQHGVGAGCTMAYAPRKKAPQVQVQGNQILFVANLLQNKHRIPKRYLRGLEFAPDAKK